MYILNKECYKTFKWLKANLEKVDPKKPNDGHYDARVRGLSYLCVLDDGTTFMAASKYRAVMLKYATVTCAEISSEDDDIDNTNLTEELKDGFYSLNIKKNKVFLESVPEPPYFPTFIIDTKDYKSKGDVVHMFNGEYLNAITSPFEQVKMRTTSKSGAAFPILLEMRGAQDFLSGKYYGFLMPRVNFYPERNIISELESGKYLELRSTKPARKLYMPRKHTTRKDVIESIENNAPLISQERLEKLTTWIKNEVESHTEDNY